MERSTTDYPKRPPFFAFRFCRLMAKVCLANDIGPEGCWLLAVIAHTEDAKGYRGPVTFFNEQLFPIVGLGSVDSLSRLRTKAIGAGWLTYLPGGKGRAGRYWVIVPEHFRDMDDGPSDEHAGKYFVPIVRKNAEESAETTARQPRDNREECAEHSSLTLTQEEEPPSEGGKPASPSVNEVPGTSSPKPARKSPTGPHHELIRAFTDAWQAKYGNKYPFNAGKDAKAFQWFRSQVNDDIAMFQGIVERFLADEDPFYTGHEVGMLRAKFARWLVNPAPRPPKISGFRTRDQQIFDELNSIDFGGPKDG